MAVYVNQEGYRTHAQKHATISGEKTYRLLRADGTVILEGSVGALKFDDCSAEDVAVIDFSQVTESGRYYFETENGKSAAFTIDEKVYDKLFFDSMKMFYFQRCGIALEEKYAGKFTHKACHCKDVAVLRNESVRFSCNGGWHDAGDYGRYVTAGAVAVGHLLYAYELHPEAFDVNLNIPESGNGVPDILNECRYELEWFLKMQAADGGVYHKCTSIHHAPFSMPEDDLLDFIVTPVSSLATADFSAVCALASRIYRPFDEVFAEQLKHASMKAYDWLIANPGLIFEDPKECATGTYDDLCDADERMWACVEMYRVTGREDCVSLLNRMMELQISTTALGWGDVAGFAALCVFTDKENCFSDYVVSALKGRWMDEADRLLSISKKSGFELAMHSYDFPWGSNMIVLTNCDKLMVAYELTGDETYLNAACCQLDYILGRNALNFSYVTGHGENACAHPHNRPTESDGIDEMIPGFVSGGPNQNPCDEVAMKMISKGTAPMKCYVDHWGAFSTNEITIYWNSPLVFALAFLV